MILDHQLNILHKKKCQQQPHPFLPKIKKSNVNTATIQINLIPFVCHVLEPATNYSLSLS